MKAFAIVIALLAGLHAHAWPAAHGLRPHRPIVSPTPTPTCVYDVPPGVGTLQRGLVNCGPAHILIPRQP